MRRNRLIADLGLTVLLGATFLTREGPGRLPHALAGALLISVVTVHLMQHRPWIRTLRRRWRTHPQRNLALVNTALAAVYGATLVSGPIAWRMSGAAGTVHEIAGFSAIALSIVHIIANRREVVRMLRRRSPLGPAAPPA